MSLKNPKKDLKFKEFEEKLKGIQEQDDWFCHFDMSTILGKGSFGFFFFYISSPIQAKRSNESSSNKNPD